MYIRWSYLVPLSPGFELGEEPWEEQAFPCSEPDPLDTVQCKIRFTPFSTKAANDKVGRPLSLSPCQSAADRRQSSG